MATKNRHRINIWITDEQYDALWELKKRTGRSLNQMAQTGVATEIATLKLVYDKFPYPSAKDVEKSRQVRQLVRAAFLESSEAAR